MKVLEESHRGIIRALDTAAIKLAKLAISCIRYVSWAARTLARRVRQRGQWKKDRTRFWWKDDLDMMRKLALTVAFGLAVPAAAIACSEKREQANTTTDGQQIVLAQADTTKPPAKKSSAKKKKAKKAAPKSDAMK
jgi:hypothetical protein